MRAVAMTLAGKTSRNPEDVSVQLREIIEEQARQRVMLVTILELLQRGRGPRDAADVALLIAIAEAIGDRWFTSAQLIAHGEADPALRKALLDCDIETPRELGWLCRRLEGSGLRGLRLERGDETRDGILWRVRVSE